MLSSPRILVWFVGLYLLAVANGCAWLKCKICGEPDEHHIEPHEYGPASPPTYRQQAGRGSRSKADAIAAGYSPSTTDVISDPDFQLLLRKQVEATVAQQRGIERPWNSPATTASTDQSLAQELVAALRQNQRSNAATAAPSYQPPATANQEVLSEIRYLSDAIARLEANQRAASRSETASYVESPRPITSDLQQRRNREASEAMRRNNELLRRSPPLSATKNPDIALAAHDESLASALDHQLKLLRDELALLERSLAEDKPPSVNKPVATESQPSRAARETSDDLRHEMQRVLQKLAIAGMQRSGKAPPATLPAADSLPPIRGAEPSPLRAGDGTNPLSLGTTLFKAGDYRGAAEALKAVDVNQLSPENRGLVQYLLGCCLRRQGKTGEAAALFDRLAASGEGTVADYARWQLSSMQWQQNLDTQIQQLRQLRESVPDLPRP